MDADAINLMAEDIGEYAVMLAQRTWTANDIEAMAAILVACQRVRQAAADVAAEVSRHAYKHLGSGEHVVDGVGVLAVGKRRERVKYDAGRITADLRKAAADLEMRVDKETGEVRDEADVLLDLLPMVVPMTPSVGFKRGGMKALGWAPDDYVDSVEWSVPSARVDTGERR